MNDVAEEKPTSCSDCGSEIDPADFKSLTVYLGGLPLVAPYCLRCLENYWNALDALPPDRGAKGREMLERRKTRSGIVSELNS